MTQPAHEERVLALIEAELRHSDPGFLALFDRLGGKGGPGARESRRLAAVRRKRPFVALLLIGAVLAAALVCGQTTGWLAAHDAVVAGFSGRAAAAAQDRLRDWHRDIRALMCGSFPIDWGGACA